MQLLFSSLKLSLAASWWQPSWHRKRGVTPLTPLASTGMNWYKPSTPCQAKEFGVPEVWMNERLMRIAPRSFAEFLYAFEEDNGKQPDLLWLVWRYEGDYTLFDLLQVSAQQPLHAVLNSNHPDHCLLQLVLRQNASTHLLFVVLASCCPGKQINRGAACGARHKLPLICALY
jgi:hypothetical protein